MRSRYIKYFIALLTISQWSQLRIPSINKLIGHTLPSIFQVNSSMGHLHLADTNHIFQLCPWQLTLYSRQRKSGFWTGTISCSLLVCTTTTHADAVWPRLPCAAARHVPPLHGGMLSHRILKHTWRNHSRSFISCKRSLRSRCDVFQSFTAASHVKDLVPRLAALSFARIFIVATNLKRPLWPIANFWQPTAFQNISYVRQMCIQNEANIGCYTFNKRDAFETWSWRSAVVV